MYGEGNSYTAEFWQYDSRIARRWNVDPVTKEWESPYAVFHNNPILMADPSGNDPILPEGTNDPIKHEVGGHVGGGPETTAGTGIGLTRNMFMEMGAQAGVFRGNYSNLTYNKIMGYTFEQAFIDASGKSRNYATIGGAKPDALGYGMTSSSTFKDNLQFWKKANVSIYPNAVATEIKATKGNIGLTRQIKGEIDLVSASQSSDGKYARNQGVAQLNIVTFSDVSIKSTVIAYAREKGVNLTQTTAYVNPESGQIGFSLPIPLTQSSSGLFNVFYNLGRSSLYQEVTPDFNKGLLFSGKPLIGTNESGNDVDPEVNY